MDQTWTIGDLDVAETVAVLAAASEGFPMTDIGHLLLHGALDQGLEVCFVIDRSGRLAGSVDSDHELYPRMARGWRTLAPTYGPTIVVDEPGRPRPFVLVLGEDEDGSAGS